MCAVNSKQAYNGQMFSICSFTEGGSAIRTKLMTSDQNLAKSGPERPSSGMLFPSSLIRNKSCCRRIRNLKYKCLLFLSIDALINSDRFCFHQRLLVYSSVNRITQFTHFFTCSLSQHCNNHDDFLQGVSGLGHASPLTLIGTIYFAMDLVFIFAITSTD